METTAKIATDLMDQAREERRLDLMIRDFLKRYEPEGDRLDFEMDLHRIVREIYQEAAKPYEKVLIDAAMLANKILANNPPVIFTKTKIE